MNASCQEHGVLSTVRHPIKATWSAAAIW